MKYYILYNYKSALEAIHFPFIDDNTTFIITSNNFKISVIKQICIRSFTGRWKSMPYYFDVDTLSNGRFNTLNGIPFHHQSKRSTN